MAATSKSKQRSEKQPHDRSAGRKEIDSRVGRIRRPPAQRPISCGCRRPALPATRQARRRFVGGACACLSLADETVGRSGAERAIGVIHHALDAHQGIGPALGQQGRPRRRRRLVGFRFDLGNEPAAGATCGTGNAGQLLQLDALMRIGHDVVPGHRRQRAAGHAIGRPGSRRCRTRRRRRNCPCSP